jgi:hypothetical protein
VAVPDEQHQNSRNRHTSTNGNTKTVRKVSGRKTQRIGGDRRNRIKQEESEIQEGIRSTPMAEIAKEGHGRSGH